MYFWSDKGSLFTSIAGLVLLGMTIHLILIKCFKKHNSKSKNLPILSSIWFIVVLIIYLLHYDIYDRIFIFTLFLHAVLAVTGVALFSEAVFNLFKKRQILSIVTVFLIILPLIFFWFVGYKACEYVRFYVFKHKYETILSEYQRLADKSALGSEEFWEEKNDIYCHVEPGPPLRVAYSLPGGFLDNWVGVVYDPSDQIIEEINSEDSQFNNRGSLKYLFGGVIISCYKLEGHWYLCDFT